MLFCVVFFLSGINPTSFLSKVSWISVPPPGLGIWQTKKITTFLGSATNWQVVVHDFLRTITQEKEVIFVGFNLLIHLHQFYTQVESHCESSLSTLFRQVIIRSVLVCLQTAERKTRESIVNRKLEFLVKLTCGVEQSLTTSEEKMNWIQKIYGQTIDHFSSWRTCTMNSLDSLRMAKCCIQICLDYAQNNVYLGEIDPVRVDKKKHIYTLYSKKCSCRLCLSTERENFKFRTKNKQERREANRQEAELSDEEEFW